jgi:hypothetical protein
MTAFNINSNLGPQAICGSATAACIAKPVVPLKATATVPAARLTQMYALMQTTLAQQDDASQYLSFMLAVMAASRCTNKYQIEEMLEPIFANATLLLEEIFGLRPMPVRRPDFDQMAELIRAANAARLSAGRPTLPVLKN